MKRITKTALAATTAALTAFICQSTAQAQTADSLIDKLVEKGILTNKEGQALREEADKDFTRAYQSKSGLPDWVTSLRLGGDIRLRYDGIYMDPPAGVAPTFTDRNRLRYRLRVGVTATLQDNFEVGMRLTSAENKAAAGATPAGDPISGNDTLTGNGTKKLVWIDLAYAKWNALNSPDWSMTLIGGKMENPFHVSEIVFDPDYTPEGIGFQLGYNVAEGQALKFNGGLFSIAELGGGAATGSKDSYLYGAQVRWDSVWTPKWSSSVGVGVFGLSDKQNLTTAAIANVSQGNSRTAGGVLTSSFSPIATDASVTYTLESFPYYPGAFPIKFGGEYINNPSGGTIPAASNSGGGKKRNEAYSIGMTLGKSGKKGTWDLTYKWKNLEANYWYEEVVDSDHGAWYAAAPTGGAAGYQAGTNIRGHYMRAAYSPYDSLTLACTYYLFDLIDKPAGAPFSQAGRIQIDAAFKF
ncbi:MAG: putative porin [Limisphaerales bacterium]